VGRELPLWVASNDQRRAPAIIERTPAASATAAAAAADVADSEALDAHRAMSHRHEEVDQD